MKYFEPCLFAEQDSSFTLLQGPIERVAGTIPGPVHCIIWRQPPAIHGAALRFQFEANLLQLHPTGSLWLIVNDVRDRDGSLLRLPEDLTTAFVMSGWFLADKVYWRTGKTPPGVLIGKKPTRYHLGSSGVLLRFTKNKPNEAWFNGIVDTNIWERSLQEEASWYDGIITLTCPPEGIVLDPNCYNGYVAESSLKLGRQFIGII